MWYTVTHCSFHGKIFFLIYLIIYLFFFVCFFWGRLQGQRVAVEGRWVGLKCLVWNSQRINKKFKEVLIHHEQQQKQNETNHKYINISSRDLGLNFFSESVLMPSDNKAQVWGWAPSSTFCPMPVFLTHLTPVPDTGLCSKPDGSVVFSLVALCRHRGNLTFVAGQI